MESSIYSHFSYEAVIYDWGSVFSGLQAWSSTEKLFEELFEIYSWACS